MSPKFFIDVNLGPLKPQNGPAHCVSCASLLSNWNAGGVCLAYWVKSVVPAFFLAQNPLVCTRLSFELILSLKEPPVFRWSLKAIWHVHKNVSNTAFFMQKQWKIVWRLHAKYHINLCCLLLFMFTLHRNWGFYAINHIRTTKDDFFVVNWCGLCHEDIQQI